MEGPGVVCDSLFSALLKKMVVGKKEPSVGISLREAKRQRNQPWRRATSRVCHGPPFAARIFEVK